MTPILPSLLPLLTPVLAPTAQEPVSDGRPAYAFLRQNEDWSKFRAADPKADFFDPIKHVSLSDDDDVWVSFGGRLESRYEDWKDFNFGAPMGVSHDDSFVVSRALLHADLHVGQRFRAYVEGKSAQATERDLPGGRRDLDMDTLDLQQAFVDLDVPMEEGSSLRVRPGRQMLLFGAQRLVSPLPWGNTLRTWDGITAEYRSAGWSVTALATEFVPVKKTDYNSPDDELTLYGLYASRKPQNGGTGLDVYLLGNQRPEVTVNGSSGDEERLTLGARSWGPFAGQMDYEVEGAYQTGEVGDADVSAWFLAAQVGWKPAEWAAKPRFWIGLDLASGDSDPGDDEVGTFHQLFPLGHAYFGYIDAIGRQNISDASIGGKWALSPATDLAVAFHSFRLMETDDALYNAGGAPYRSGFDSKDVGTEIDLTVDHRLDRHTALYAGLSRFFAGEALEETGPSEDVDFLYLGAKFTF